MAMFKCGALIVKSFNQLLPSVTEAAKLIQNVLYVPLINEGQSDTVSSSITQLYLHAAKVNPDLDVRVILPRLHHQDTPSTITPLSNQVEALLSPLKNIDGLPEVACIRNRSRSGSLSDLQVVTLDSGEQTSSIPTDSTPSIFKTYSDVALGGTFDCIHHGHRLLLIQAALVATNRVLVGVASGPLLTNKALAELIKPTDKRINEVTEILRDCKPELLLQVLPITDVLGPTAWDEGLTCLIASKETAVAIDIINEERRKNGIQLLELHVVDLVSDDSAAPITVTNKTSSTQLRKKQLGVYREPKIKQCLSEWDETKGPYLVGLTGNTACGKSSIAKKLAAKGAHPISCDELGHKAYVSGTKAHADIVAEFGSDILNDSGEVDRKKLGGIVFADKSKLAKLNDIVWPAIWRLAEEEIALAHEKGIKVCVIDAAVLLKAEWHRKVHEVWVPVIAPKESIRRVMERDGLTEERATQRLSSQPKGSEIVEYAHLVLCTHWDISYTQLQVDKAWTELMSRISNR